jgi:hypothetical protein
VDEKTSALGYGTGIAAKERKEAGIAAKTCRAIGLAKAEGTKSAKKTTEKLSETNPSYRDYRLKLAFEFAPGLAHVYASLIHCNDVANLDNRCRTGVALDEKQP